IVNAVVPSACVGPAGNSCRSDWLAPTPGQIPADCDAQPPRLRRRTNPRTQEQGRTGVGAGAEDDAFGCQPLAAGLLHSDHAPDAWGGRVPRALGAGGPRFARGLLPSAIPDNSITSTTR